MESLTAEFSAAHEPAGACLLRAGSVASSTGDPTDLTLLHRYAHAGSQDAFEELVRRHAGWVGAVVRRKISDKHLAEDVTQAVFIILARKARLIRPDQVLSAWLFRVARFAVRDAVRQETRRQRRWERVAQMHTEKFDAQSPPSESELDDALACLSETDRQVILLRFYEDMSMAEVGVALGIAEVAAKKRVSRALKRLRDVMVRKDHRLGTIALVAILSGIARSAKAGTSAAGQTMAHSLGAAAVGGGEFSGQSLHVAQSTLRTMAGAQTRVWMAMSGGVLAAAMVVGLLSPTMGQDIFGVFRQVSQQIHGAFSLAPQISIPPGFGTADNPRTTAEVKNLWVGHANTAGWPVLPLGSPQSPLLLRTTSGSDDPVAIAQDDRGAYWYRRLNQETSFTTAHAQDPQVEFATPPSSASPYTTDHLTELAQEFFTAAAATAPSTGSDWQPIAPQSDGSFRFGFAGMQDPVDGIDVTSPQIVPEPAAGALAAGMATLLARRRRRRA